MLLLGRVKALVEHDRVVCIYIISTGDLEEVDRTKAEQEKEQRIANRSDIKVCL